ncbi:MAG: nitric oxide reductase activation protein NorD [Roseobacter sp.]
MLVSDWIRSEGLSPALRKAFEGAHRETYLRAYDRLEGAGYGAAVLRAFASAAPRVATQVGPDQAIALATDASRIAIKARPRTAEAFLDLCPIMALKLKGPQKFGQWREMIATVLRKHPKAVLPLLSRSEMLFDRLGLDPLGVWVQTGLRVAGQNGAQAIAYFQLETPEAQRRLERFAGEANFPSLESGLKSFYTALWHQPPLLREAGSKGPNGGPVRRTSFSGGLIQMPSAFSGFRGQEQQLYRASIAHVGAHKTYGGAQFKLGQLKPLQVAVVSLIEDARVETLAMRDMPGLHRLWCPFHTAQHDGVPTAQNLFAGLARALIDPEFHPTHGWVKKGVEMFHAAAGRVHDPAISRQIGNILGNDLGQTRVQFDAVGYIVQPDYRDDNLGLWDLPADPETPPPSEELEAPLADLRRTETDDKPQDRKQEQAKPETPDVLEPVKTTLADPEAGRKMASLPEYDYHDGIERDDWISVNVYDPVPGDPGFWDQLQDRHGATLARVQKAVATSETGKRRKLKQRLEGETLDLDAAIDTAIALRSNRQPDPNVYESIIPPPRSIAVHLLLDMSQSTADPARPDLTILDMERDAAAILASTMAQLGDDLAITAFSSAGRHDVRVVPVKTFDTPLDETTASALSGLRPGYSTRMGAALRYACSDLAGLSRYRKIVLLVTDGAPSDIDMPDPEYLVEDARRAVQRMRAQGIDAICVALGNDAGQRHTEIFGRKTCVQITDIATLPAKLSAFYLRMTR